MPHDTSKKQRLTDMDFSQEGNHVALVGKAANGKTKFLVTKSLDTVEKAHNDVLDSVKIAMMSEEIDRLIAEEQGDDNNDKKVGVDGKIEVSMPLSDLLQMVCYLSERESDKIVDSIVKTVDSEVSDEAKAEFAEKLKALANKDSAPGAITKNLTIQTEENSMGDNTNTKAPVVKDGVTEGEGLEDLQKSLDAKDAKIVELEKAAADASKSSEGLEDIVKGMQAREGERILKAFNDTAEKFSSLGSDEGTGAILKEVASLEGGSKILGMLDTAMELINKSELLDEVGGSGEAEVKDSYGELEAIAKELRASDTSLTESEAIVKAASMNPKIAGGAR